MHHSCSEYCKHHCGRLIFVTDTFSLTVNIATITFVSLSLSYTSDKVYATNTVSSNVAAKVTRTVSIEEVATMDDSLAQLNIKAQDAAEKSTARVKPQSQDRSDVREIVRCCGSVAVQDFGGKKARFQATGVGKSRCRSKTLLPMIPTIHHMASTNSMIPV